MKQWEYDIEYTGANKSASDAVHFCNQKGADGWELINIEGNSIRGYELIFKREKPNEEQREFTGRSKPSGRK